MRIPSLLLAVLLVAASGCDSVEEAAVAGPTIQFGTASLTASESDGTVEIPVTLTGGESGKQYTVQVLFADATSRQESLAPNTPAADRDSTAFTLRYGQDITGFGEAVGANRVATVTLTGPEDTQVVTVDVIEDSDVEAAEVAVFVLQQASDGAEIGDNREFRLQIGTPPISQTRLRPNGDVVTVEGIVTGRFGRYTFLQDGTAGISVYAFSDTDFGMADIVPGDRVQVRGSLSEFGANDGPGLGLKQIFVGNNSPATFRVLSRGNPLPAAQTLTIAQILANGEEYESERIRVTGLTVNTTDVVFNAGGSAGNYTVTDGTGSMILRINSGAESELGGTPVPQGSFTFVGALGQFGGNYQLTPLRTSDLETGD